MSSCRTSPRSGLTQIRNRISAFLLCVSHSQMTTFHSQSPGIHGLCLASQRRLRISDITALSRPHGGLAFLSPYWTAKGDVDISDEAIRILQQECYLRGMEGSLIQCGRSDYLAPNVTKEVYEHLNTRLTIGCTSIASCYWAGSRQQRTTYCLLLSCMSYHCSISPPYILHCIIPSIMDSIDCRNFDFPM